MTNIIKVRLEDDVWTDALWYQAEAFKRFKMEHTYENETIYNDYGYNFKIKRINGAIYLIRENGTKMPICDWNNVKVFLLDHRPVNWYTARNYQTWAYFNFMYNRSGLNEIKYCSKESNIGMSDDTFVEIPINDISPNIIFKMLKNDDGRIFYEKDDINKTLVRISDNDFERLDYLRFYTRMTSPLITSDQQNNSLIIPQMIKIVTVDNKLVCKICNNFRKNIIFKPCKHDSVCSHCASRILSTTNKLDCPICRHVVHSIDKIKPVNWFESFFGFIEKDYSYNKSQMFRLFLIGNQEKINEINVGSFMLINLKELYDSTEQIYGTGSIKFKNIVGDIKEINRSAENNNATIQVASQFNCLEMVDYNELPENGITCYQNDRTQGPICVMCTPAGLAYRNYIFNGGQTKNNQIDMTSELLSYFKSIDNSIDWKVINGYLMINDVQVLIKISNLLKNDDIRLSAKYKIKAGIHNNLGIFIDGKKYDHKVNHILCSGLPISYHYYPMNNINLWDELSELFLEAYYEITILMACLNEHNNTCYLTQIGGGAFGMKNSLIISAIKKACLNLVNKGYNLNIKMVHYNTISQLYCELER
jgi:hypothetical protein